MPDVEEKTVDIDTTGPGAEVNIEEEKKEVETVEPVVEKEEVKEAVEEKQESGDKQQEEKPKEEEKPKQELEEYSEGVQKRSAKLTKKRREAERQKEAAIDFARGGQAELTELKTRLKNLEPNDVKAMENRVTSGLEAAKAKLTQAREAGDINAEVDAQRSIAQLTVEETRLNALKERQSQDKEQAVKTPSLEQNLHAQTPPPDPTAQDRASKHDSVGQESASQ